MKESRGKYSFGVFVSRFCCWMYRFLIYEGPRMNTGPVQLIIYSVHFPDDYSYKPVHWRCFCPGCVFVDRIETTTGSFLQRLHHTHTHCWDIKLCEATACPHTFGLNQIGNKHHDDDNTFGLWIISGTAKLPNNTKKNLKQSQMCGAFPPKKRERASSAGSQIPFDAASAENIKDLEGTLWNLAILPGLCATCSRVLLWLRWLVTEQRLIPVKVEEKEKLHVTLDFFEAGALREV